MCMSVRFVAHTRTYFKDYMKNLFTILFLSMAVSLPVMADDIYFQENFEKGISSQYTLLDRDENPNKSGMSNINLSNGSWATAQYDKGTSAAMSSAHCTYDYPVEDWMILPQINIKSNMAVLAWDAFSVHYDFRENYKVMISESGTKTSDFVEVYSVENEEYYVRRHVLSLADYEGKNIYIAFVHQDQNKYLLGIDNIKVGVFFNEYVLVNNTDVSAKGGQEVEICGSVRNVSSAHHFLPTIVAGDAKWDPYEQEDLPGVLVEPGQEMSFSFSVMAPEEGTVDYTVGVKQQVDGQTVWSASDTIYCSAFPRNILVEKFTGTWCNNCPEGTITLRKFEQRFRNRIITVEGHCAMGASEPMADAYYHPGLQYWIHNLPGMIYNRTLGMISQTAKDDGLIYKAMRKPVTAEIVPTVKYTKEHNFLVNTTVRFSQDYDNSADRYRVGYVLAEKVVHEPNDTKYAQSNSCQYPQNREFYFLPSSVPSSLAFFHNVGRGNATSFDGAPQSLPNETLTAYTDYEVSGTVEMPGTPIFDDDYEFDPKNFSLVVVLIYTRDKSVMAAYRVDTDDIDWSSALEEVQDGARHHINVVDDAVLVRNIEGNATVRIYGVDGRLIATAQGAGEVVAHVGQYAGVAIVSVETAAGVKNEKVLIK